jgi:hypothetical protein
MPERRRAPQRPEVIVDFVFEAGRLFIAVKNIGDKPALKVSVTFDHKVFGLGGTKEISALPLFKNIEFLAPQREIATFLDSSAAYFSRQEPTLVAAHISFQDSRRRRYRTTIRHDLQIYRDIGYVE